MTLRELFAWIVDWRNAFIEGLARSLWTIFNVNLLDWPIWLLAIVGILTCAVGILACYLVWLIFGSHVYIDGRRLRGWHILGIEIARVAGWGILWGAFIVVPCVLVLGVVFAILIMLAPDVAVPRWWGAAGLIAIAALALGLVRTIRALARRGRAVIAAEAAGRARQQRK